LDSTKYGDSRVFNFREYLKANSDLPQSWNYASALRDWLQFGAARGRNSHTNFHVREYASINSVFASEASNDIFRAVAHYLDVGIAASLVSISQIPVAGFPVLRQPAFDQFPSATPYVAAWNTGTAAITDRPTVDFSGNTGLVVPGNRSLNQWQLPGASGGGGVLPSAVQQYNGWLGVSIDTRSTQMARAVSRWPSDDPVAFNLGVAYKVPPTELPLPFSSPNRGIVWEGEIQIPIGVSKGQNGAYVIVYHLLRDRTTGSYIWIGVVVFDARGALLSPTYLAFDNCVACTQFLIASSHLGSSVAWHSPLPSSMVYTGQPFRDIRQIGFTISGTQLVSAIRAAKAAYPRLSDMSENPSDYFLHNWNIDFELGSASLGDAWLTASFRLIRAGFLQ
jgi:hypothetical protein